MTEVREGRRRRKLSYREIFFMHNGPGPYLCHFCNEKVEAISITVHHKDHNEENHAPDNLKASHVSCHMSHHNAGRVMSPAEREKRRQGRLGKLHTEDTKARMSMSHTGKKISEETKARMSESHRTKWERYE